MALSMEWSTIRAGPLSDPIRASGALPVTSLVSNSSFHLHVSLRVF